ncbi:MAG: nucleotidyltransferase domain-containing protein [Leptospiraceae bacterium]|nr:nucleotidyltransferase domain-containing protein [Leptospiraceae bacterium]
MLKHTLKRASTISPMTPDLTPIITFSKETFTDNLLAIILYGSHARGTATEESDIDLCFVFQNYGKDNAGDFRELDFPFEEEFRLDKLFVSKERFQTEWAPIYTSVKKTGKIIFGEIDFSVSSSPAQERYAEFFIESKKLESWKVNMAKKMFADMESTPVDYLYIAVKHTIQTKLALLDRGFSSKFETLESLCREHFSKGIAKDFRFIYDLYQKSEFEASKKDFLKAIECADTILKLYE